MKLPNFSESIKETSDIEIVEVKDFEEPTLPKEELKNPKVKDKFIKRIEQITRSSIEYKRYIKYLKSEMDITSCTFLPNIDVNEVKGVGLEMHHYPLTLFDMTAIILEDKIAKSNGNRISAYDVASTVMKEHFKNNVGLVPLSKTVHELAHNGEIFIPLNLVFGNYPQLLRDYHLGVTEDLKSSLATLIELTERLGETYDPEVLNVSIQHFSVDGQLSNQTIELEEEQTA